jgi:hypothetical protein
LDEREDFQIDFLTRWIASGSRLRDVIAGSVEGGMKQT